MIRLSDCPYADDIRRTMQAYLPMWDWRWGVAQLYQESQWKLDAKSSAGAEGIAQFEPPTWADQVEQMGFIDIASPYDPTYAIPAYGHYMRSLRSVWLHVDRTEDERRKLTMASYNCGTGNMLKAQWETARGAGTPIATDYASIIAALPHITGAENAKQTSDYVMKIEQWYGELGQ